MRNFKLPKTLFWAVFIASLLANSEIMFAQSKVPPFDNYPVKQIYKGRNAPPIITKKDDRMFRTRIRIGAKQKPNFAGQYIISTWGCGASCSMGVAINAKTGKIYWLPHNAQGVEYRLTSRLIIFSGLRNESEKDNVDDSHFYEFKNGRFVFIKTLRRK